MSKPEVSEKQSRNFGIGNVTTFSEFEDWNVYVEQLEFYFKANRVTSSEEKKNILLSVCGAETFAKIRTLVAPSTLNDCSYEDILSKAASHYVPTKNFLAARCTFRRRMKADNENFTQYLADLKRLAQACKFENEETLNTELRDQLTAGIKDDVMLQRILAEKEPTFQKVVDIATTI